MKILSDALLLISSFIFLNNNKLNYFFDFLKSISIINKGIIVE